MKKKHKKAAVELTQEQIKALSNAMTRKIALMMADYYKRTGQIAAKIEIINNFTPRVDGLFDLSQTVNIGYGVPDFRLPENRDVQIEVNRT